MGSPWKPLSRPSEKFCVACQRTRPRRHFYPALKAHDGLQTWCKYCAAVYGRQRRIRRKVAA